ncbi:MAG TPA: hypothetical protein VEL31_28175 [Ktedonobacteraceae bacterium]|nr:hypothetical protein [Ktedonobacteraceae bacterium]
MQNQPSMGGHAEQNRQLAQHLETVLFPEELSEDQHLLTDLLDAGFEWEEAIKLLRLRDHLYENPEMRQRTADDSRMHFVRWLFEHGEIGED